MQARIRVGTSGWSYDDWVGPFYPPGTDQSRYLEHYAARFDAAEVDSTYYRPPSRRMAESWAERTPSGFAFALKAPRTITHEKILLGCDAEMERLLWALEPLKAKLKCLLLQFTYFSRDAFPSPQPFFERLEEFLGKYAERVPLACEIRNKSWLSAHYFDLLRAHGVTAALVEHAWLPPVDELVERQNVVTGPFSYVRLVGDRQRIERITRTWDKVVVDRSRDLARLARALRRIAEEAEVLVFANNHYAGHAPATSQELRQACDAL